MSLSLVFFLVIASVLVLTGVMLSTRQPERRFAQAVMACIYAALGAMPLTIVASLHYIRDADFVWMIHGPYPFSRLGGGPFSLFTYLTLLSTTVICWGFALTLLRKNESAYPS